MVLEPTVLELDDVTPAWMSEVLGRPGQLRSMTSTEIGTGQVGTNVRFDLEWAPGNGADDGPPASVVGKFPSTDALSRRTGGETESYIREVGFYRDVQASVAVRTPKTFHLNENVAENQFVLIMEDLSGAEPGKQLAGCSVSDAELAVREAAALHGPRWGDASLEELPWLHRRTSERATQHQNLFLMVAPGFADRYRDRLRPEILAIAQWLGPRLTSVFAAYEGPVTLVHGDYRLDNMLFGRNPDAPALTVVDWQTCALGAGPLDVAYFLGAGLLAEDRRTYEQHLFDVYVDALSPWVEPGRDQLWHNYRIGSTAGYIMAVIASQIVGQTERGDDMFVAMAERHGQHLLDLGIEDAVA